MDDRRGRSNSRAGERRDSGSSRRSRSRSRNRNPDPDAGIPRIGDHRSTTTSISNLSSGPTSTYSLNVRHRSGSVTSFHFHPERDGEIHASTLDRRQMGAVEHYSATNNSITRQEARDLGDNGRHQEVRDVNFAKDHRSRDYHEARAGHDAQRVHSKRNPVRKQDLDEEMDAYFNDK
jgi:hypothetical protein